MASEKDLEIIGLRKEIAYLNDKIEFLKQQICGENGHVFEIFDSKISRKERPIFCKLADGHIQVRSWRDITNVYICKKCGVFKYKRRELPLGYSETWK